MPRTRSGITAYPFVSASNSFAYGVNSFASASDPFAYARESIHCPKVLVLASRCGCRGRSPFRNQSDGPGDGYRCPTLMDMSVMAVSGCPSIAAKLTVLFLFAYPFVVWGLSRYRREVAGPMAGSAVPATLTPLFVAAAAGWLGIAALLRGLAQAGGGRAARAAGVSESLSIIGLGATVAALVGAIIWLRDQFRSPRPDGQGSPARGSRIVVGMTALLAALLVSHAAVARRLVEPVESLALWRAAALTCAVVAAVGSVVSLCWLTLSRRYPTPQIGGSRRTVAAVCTAGAAVIAYGGWHFTAVCAAIARHG